MGQSGQGLSEKTQNAVVSRLEDAPICLALLFGSHARDEATDDSDIDIALSYESGLSEVTDTHLSLVADLTRILGQDDVDVIRLSSADPRIAVAALEHGQLLVGSPEDVTQLREQLDDERKEREETIGTKIAEAERAIERRLEQRKHG